MKCNIFTSKASSQETAQLVDQTKKSVNSRFRNWEQEIRALKWLHCIHQSHCSVKQNQSGD